MAGCKLRKSEEAERGEIGKWFVGDPRQLREIHRLVVDGKLELVMLRPEHVRNESRVCQLIRYPCVAEPH